MGLGLAFESSCDETGVALVRDGVEVLAQPLFSQIDLHRPYGGIVPEFASRAHFDKFSLLLDHVLQENKLAAGMLDFVAVTVKPGLVGSLLVGFQTALATARFFQAPLIGIHHLEAHLTAIRLSGVKNIPYPCLGLLLSGGNSAIYHMTDIGKLAVVGDTLDDACGEALDKAATLLGLGYPGGPLIEKYAAQFEADPQNSDLLQRGNVFPRLLKDLPRNQVAFSFSGLKTALSVFMQKNPTYPIGALAYFFQETVIEAIVRNVEHAFLMKGKLPLVAAGGVMANQAIRKALQRICDRHGVALYVPEFKYCTDNAAMIASCADLYFSTGKKGYPLSVSPENSFNAYE